VFVVRKGVRNSKIRYKCTKCNSWFTVNKSKKITGEKLLKQHVDGTPYRKLADQYDSSPTTVYRKNLKASKALPHCANITREHCVRYTGILQVDGKYISVRPYERKIPVLYGIDYATHDTPTYKLIPSENYQACLAYFTALRLLNYPLKALICDDNENIRDACKAVYPKVIIQLCQVHFMRNIGKVLSIKTDPTYRPFMARIGELFADRVVEEVFNGMAQKILLEYINDAKCVAIMQEIGRKRPLLLAYLRAPGIPRTNNLIECFNSHLNGRLKTIKGFKSFKHADLWLNAYFVRRRYKPYTDCGEHFKKLNGKKSIDIVAKDKTKLPKIF